MKVVMALKAAIQTKGWPITGKDVRDALYDLKPTNCQGLTGMQKLYENVDNRGTVMLKFLKVEQKRKGLSTSLVAVEKSDWIAAPTILPKGYEAKCKGVKDLCKKEGWTFYSPESGLITGK